MDWGKALEGFEEEVLERSGARPAEVATSGLTLMGMA